MAKERPILFSTPMVQAILEGRKTMTRRAVKYPCKSKTHHISIGDGAPPESWCPYGQIGDVLWVRETSLGMKTRYFYRASFHESNNDWFKEQGYKWKPSIFMPKAACRIRLEITGIRVEKLNVISFEDASYEGVERSSDASGKTWYKNYAEEIPHNYKNPIQSFMSLWEKINGKFSWDKEPWVWVIEFKKLA